MNIGSGALKRLVYIALACALAQTGALGADVATPAANSTVSAQDKDRFESVSAQDAVEAQALLQRAVAYYKAIKDLALAHFGPQGEFVRDDLYVYVVSTSGVLLASGGLSSGWIGTNVADQQDAVGKPFVREVLDKARKNGSGTVEYHWLNPYSNKTERKIAYFQKVGDRIILVGYFTSANR
ncbi:MAG: cache domain-containing protein [Burkholderiales bacterium]